MWKKIGVAQYRVGSIHRPEGAYPSRSTRGAVDVEITFVRCRGGVGERDDRRRRRRLIRRRCYSTK